MRIIVLLSMLIVSCTMAQAEQGRAFPGIGSRKVWERACDLNNEALSARKANRVEQAIDLYKKAIAIYPFDGDFYHNLGIAYYARGDYRTAELNARKATKMDPTAYDYQWELARDLFQLGKLTESKAIVLRLKTKTKDTEELKQIDKVLKAIADKLTARK